MLSAETKKGSQEKVRGGVERESMCNAVFGSVILRIRSFYAPSPFCAQISFVHARQALYRYVPNLN